MLLVRRRKKVIMMHSSKQKKTGGVDRGRTGLDSSNSPLGSNETALSLLQCCLPSSKGGGRFSLSSIMCTLHCNLCTITVSVVLVYQLLSFLVFGLCVSRGIHGECLTAHELALRSQEIAEGWTTSRIRNRSVMRMRQKLSRVDIDELSDEFSLSQLWRACHPNQRDNVDPDSQHSTANSQSSPSSSSSFEWRLRWFVLLAGRRGGSTWTHHILKTHPHISVTGETLMEWNNQHCSRFSLTKHKCDAQGMIQALMIGFDRAMRPFCRIPGEQPMRDDTGGIHDDDDNDGRNNADNEGLDHQTQSDHSNSGINDAASNLAPNRRIRRRMIRNGAMTVAIGVNIQVEQVPKELYGALIRWLIANRVSVIHMRRLSAVSSLWSYNADQFERTQTGSFDKVAVRARSEHRKKVSLLPLIPKSQATRYTRLIDGKHDDFAAMLAAHSDLVPWMQVSYEQLVGQPLSMLYWNSTLAFLGVSNSHEQIDFSRWFRKEHSLACYQRTSNWMALRHHLTNSPSLFACQKVFS